MMKIETKTVLIDTADVFEREIEEVLEYYYAAFIMWATIRFKDDTRTYGVPLFALAIKHKPVFN